MRRMPPASRSSSSTRATAPPSLSASSSCASAGSVRVAMRVRSEMLNGHGTCHGGVVFALADTAFAYACNSHGIAMVAAGASIEFLARGEPGRAADRRRRARHRSASATASTTSTVCDQTGAIGAIFAAAARGFSRADARQFTARRIDMNEAFICDAIRTPFGRYGGALSSVRPDDLAAVVLRELMRRNPALDPRGGGRRDSRLRQSGRRRQSQCRAHERAARRPAGRRCRAPRSIACAAPGSMRSPRASRMITAGEAEVVHGRRRREHEPRAVRDVEERRRRSRATCRCSTPPSAGASSIRC